MKFQAGGFDWDDGNRSKCQKHGVSIAEIETLFLHSPRVAPDPKHSGVEDRLIAVGDQAWGGRCSWLLRCAQEKAAR